MLSMETERLVVRNFKEDDWKDLYEYLSQKEVLRYEPEDPSDEEDCRKKASERSKGNNFWAVCLKESGKMIGHLYFQQGEPLEFLTWELGAHRIIAMCNPENIPSWKLMERLKMRREGFFKKKAFFRRNSGGGPIWFDAYEYAILQEEWTQSGE